MDSRVRRAVKFMEQNLGSKLTEKELADQCRLTSQYFCVLFKSETSETPTRFLNHLRMEKAREMLESTEHSHLSIKEIAMHVGCRELSHFVRDFEKRFGLSPKRYRTFRGRAS